MPPLTHLLKSLLPTLSTLNLVIANLTPCGVICAGNMLQQGPQLNCNKTAAAISNIGCLCGTSNFNNGVNDCLRGVCGTGDSSGSSIATSWISSVCSSVGVTSITTIFNPSMVTSTGTSDPVTINILSSTTSASVPSTIAAPPLVKKAKFKREFTRRDQPTTIVTSTHTSSSMISTVQTTVTPVAEPAKLDLLPQLSGTELTPCGTICIGNMLQKGDDLNCTDSKILNNIGCLCSAQNFHYGINDCLGGACGSIDTSGSSIATAWVTSICSSASASSTVSPSSGSPVSITILPTSDTSPLLITVLPTVVASSISGLNKQIASTTVSGSKSSISMTTATISLTTETSSPTTTPQPSSINLSLSTLIYPQSGWAFKSCYPNPTSFPKLTATSTSIPNMNIPACLNYCQDPTKQPHNYHFAGISNGTTCSCGNAVVDAATDSGDNGTCNVACPMNINIQCGGSEAMAV